MSFSSARIWNFFDFLCFLMRHICQQSCQKCRRNAWFIRRDASFIDRRFSRGRSTLIHASEAKHLARSLPYTRGHVPGGEKITEPGRGGYRGRGRSGRRRTGNFRDRETQERSINTRAFNLLIHTVTRASVAPTRWSATVWARWWSVPRGPFTKRNRPRISILEFQWV